MASRIQRKSLLGFWKSSSLQPKCERACGRKLERRASADLRRQIRIHRNKTNFDKVPLRFLVKRLNAQAFKEYREVIHDEFLQGKKLPPVEDRKNDEEVVKEDDDDDGEFESLENLPTLPRRTKRQRSDEPELTHEFQELADLAMQYDDGNEGIWVDIFENASPHLQVLLRKATPRTPSSPPESLVPLQLRPAFREYCARRLAKMSEGGPFGLEDEFNEEEEEVEEEDVEEEVEEEDGEDVDQSEVPGKTTVDLLPVGRTFSHRSVIDALQRQKKRLEMMFTRLEKEIDDFARQEKSIVKQEAPGADADVFNEELDIVFIQLYSDYRAFKEQEAESLDEHIKKYRHSALNKPDVDGSALESMLNSYHDEQGQRLEAFLIRLHEAFEGNLLSNRRE